MIFENDERMLLADVMRLSGCVGAAVALPLERPFIGCYEADCLLNLQGSADAAEARRIAFNAKRAIARSLMPKKPRKTRLLFEGAVVAEGWLAEQILATLIVNQMISRLMAEKIGVVRGRVDACLSYMLGKKLVSWATTSFRYKPRLWSITQQGRDWLEAQSI